MKKDIFQGNVNFVIILSNRNVQNDTPILQQWKEERVNFFSMITPNFTDVLYIAV